MCSVPYTKEKGLLQSGLLQDLVDQTVLNSPLRVHVDRPPYVLAHLLHGSLRVLAQRPHHLLSHLPELKARQVQIAGLAPLHSDGLLDHDRGRGQGGAVALLSCGQEHGGLAPRRADAHRVHRVLDVVQRVQDREGLRVVREPIVLLGGPGRVDVKVDGLLRVLELQVQKLCDEELRHRRHQSHTKVHDPFFEQKRRQVRRRLRCGISNQRRDHPRRSGVHPPSVVFVASSLPDDGVVERRLPRPPAARGAGRPRATPHGWPVVVRLDPHGRGQPIRSRGHAHDKSTPKR
mmetsp:Transcript_8572/g.25817  ORF Transcript_8572/g.25817 Transcript_8572/m.25817 type:complete len:290 (-) Transcript_8572:55-924(-)